MFFNAALPLKRVPYISGTLTSGRDRRGRSQSMIASCSSPNLSEQLQSNVTSPAIIRTKLQLVDLAGSECVGE